MTCYELGASNELLETISLLSLILNYAKFPPMMQNRLKVDVNVLFSCLLWRGANKDMNREAQEVLMAKLPLLVEYSPACRPHPPEKTWQNLLSLPFGLSHRNFLWSGWSTLPWDAVGWEQMVVTKVGPL